MCGRFANAIPSSILTEYFSLSEEPAIPPRWNIAPTQIVPIIKLDEGGGRKLNMARWGLVPHWAKDLAIGNRLINARSETVHEKPAFRQAIRSHRCLVPASGFFEWVKTTKARVPYYISMKDGVPMAFAGIWDVWNESDGKAVETFSILTTSANSLVMPIHDRMPVMFQSPDFDLWLDRSMNDPEKLRPLYQPCPSQALQSWQVSTLVNSPAHETEDCLLPVNNP